MKVYVLHVEGNTDHYSEVLGVYASEQLAQQAESDAIAEAIDEGEVVEHVSDNEYLDWTRSFRIYEFDVVSL